MTWFLIAVIVVCLVALGMLIGHDRVAVRELRAGEERAREAGERAREAEERAGTAEAEVAAARAARDEALAQAPTAEPEVTESQPAPPPAPEPLAAPPAPPPPAVEQPGDAHLETLWALALLEEDRAWRLTMAVPAGADDGPRVRTLADALGESVARIREETGTPGNVHVDLPDPPGPGPALLALRATQGLLALLSRHSEGFDLDLRREGDRLVATVVCDDFAGPDTVADEATALLWALRPVEGEVDIDRADDGRLRARLTFPAR